MTLNGSVVAATQLLANVHRDIQLFGFLIPVHVAMQPDLTFGAIVEYLYPLTSSSLMDFSFATIATNCPPIAVYAWTCPTTFVPIPEIHVIVSRGFVVADNKDCTMAEYRTILSEVSTRRIKVVVNATDNALAQEFYNALAACEQVGIRDIVWDPQLKTEPTGPRDGVPAAHDP